MARMNPLNWFEIDEDDIKIIHIIQDEPHVTHTEIARRINKSQPAVGARVSKLERKGILVRQNGANLKVLLPDGAISMACVDLQTRVPDHLIKEVMECPFMIQCVKKTGRYNLSVMIVARDVDFIEEIIDYHFRNHPGVKFAETSYIVKTFTDMCIPIDWEYLKYDFLPCGSICCTNTRDEHESEDGVGEGLELVLHQ